MLGALVLAPQAASAAVSCTYDGASRSVNVSLSAPADDATISRDADGTIAVNLVSCGAATVNNVDGVYVSDVSGGDTRSSSTPRNGAFAPGYTDEGLFGSEIEFWVDLGGGQNDQVTCPRRATGRHDRARDPGDQSQRRSRPVGGLRCLAPGVETVMVFGSAANDWVSGQGGHGTGGPSNDT